MSKMYNELALWWPLISPPEEYAKVVAQARDRWTVSPSTASHCYTKFL